MFNFQLTLPSGRNVRIPEINNEHLFTIFKFCIAEDVVGFANYIEDKIFYNIKGLSCVEKIYITLYIRILCLGPVIEMQGIEGEDGQSPKISVDLYDVIERLENLPVIEDKVIDIETFKLTVGLPGKIGYETSDEVVFGCVKVLDDGETKLDIESLTKEQLDEIYNLLPPFFLSKINDFLVSSNNSLGELVVIKGSENLKLKEVKCSLIGNSITSMIMSLFKHDYQSFVEMVYHFINKVGGSYEDFLKLTLQDTQIMLRTYQREMEKQNEELNKAKNGHK